MEGVSLFYVGCRFDEEIKWSDIYVIIFKNFFNLDNDRLCLEI